MPRAWWSPQMSRLGYEVRDGGSDGGVCWYIFCLTITPLLVSASPPSSWAAFCLQRHDMMEISRTYSQALLRHSCLFLQPNLGLLVYLVLATTSRTCCAVFCIRKIGRLTDFNVSRCGLELAEFTHSCWFLCPKLGMAGQAFVFLSETRVMRAS